MIKVFTHVGTNPVLGGGVATYVNNLRKVFEAAEVEYEVITVPQRAWFQNFILFLYHRKSSEPIILNSGFHLFSLLMIIFSRKNKILLMPHGEFLSSALRIKKVRKKLVLMILKFIFTVFPVGNQIILATSSEEELENFQKWIKVKQSNIIQDVITFDKRNRDFNLNRVSFSGPVQIIMVGRMVPMKGYLKVFNALLNSTPANINLVRLYYIAENEVYLEQIKETADQLRYAGLEVELLRDYDSEMIYNECKDLNCVFINPSSFESFGYALLENLWMPNRPIVGYQNDFTQHLASHDLCDICLGNLSEAIVNIRPNDTLLTSKTVMDYAQNVNRQTLRVVETLGDNI